MPREQLSVVFAVMHIGMSARVATSTNSAFHPLLFVLSETGETLALHTGFSRSGLGVSFPRAMELPGIVCAMNTLPE